MDLSRFFAIAAIACITSASLVHGQQYAPAEYPTEYPAEAMGSGAPFADYGYANGEGNPCGDGCSSGCCESCGGCNEPGCFEKCFSSWDVGGWAQVGYHTYDSPLRFNNHADRVNLHQMWLYAEKVADRSKEIGFGGRIDYVYGVDAQDTQAFGGPEGHWDTSWDHGIYGFALPQAYGEVTIGDKASIKVGHFFTIIGYEVVTAPDNFFYSHAYTMVNSEPFTHSGALATIQASEFITLYAGYSAGWDSGFEDNGDTVLAGLSLVMTDDITVTYTSTSGRLNESSTLFGPVLHERGQMHSIVGDSTCGNLNYILQLDYLDTEDQFSNTYRNTIGINNYFLYEISEQLAAGLRFEYYNVECNPFIDDQCDIYALTFGLNIIPADYVKIRPEVRMDWDVDDNPLGINELHPIRQTPRESQTTFGIDAIVTF